MARCRMSYESIARASIPETQAAKLNPMHVGDKVDKLKGHVQAHTMLTKRTVCFYCQSVGISGAGMEKCEVQTRGPRWRCSDRAACRERRLNPQGAK